MKNIVLIGGMGSGKTTLGTALKKENPNINLIYMNRYGAGIPLTLIASDSGLISLPKADYIETIFKNGNIECKKFSRQEMDDIGKKVFNAYGDTIWPELILRSVIPGVQNVVDNAVKASTIKYLKERGLYIVALHCRFETQVQRRLHNRKGIDPENKSLLEEQIKQTNAYVEVDAERELAHAVYDSDTFGLEHYSAIAKEIIKATNYRSTNT
ncbi:AAA family ATPase [Candidatus Woesearchaeota archaeon]|nr:AAA family ATPase [Candidatus Woesearchaeota archaeon]